MRYLIYARVSPKGSTWSGTETTIPDQIETCKRHVMVRDEAAQIEVISDTLISGASVDKRPAFRFMVDSLHAKRADWDCLVVWRLDRAFRSTADAFPFFKELQAQGKGFISITEGMDFSSPAGRALLGMLCVFAEFELQSGSQRTKLKMVSICQGGGWPAGRTPAGYKRGAPHDNVLQVDDAKADTVRAIYQRYANGSGVAELVRDYGYSRSTVWDILRNPIYKGTILYDGVEYPGKHEPLMTPAQWQAAQPRECDNPHRTCKPRTTGRAYDYLLAGFVRCECGRAMTTTSTHKGEARYPYYICTDTVACKRRVNAEHLDRTAIEALAGHTITDAERRAAVAAIRAERDKAIAEARPEIKRLQKAVTEGEAAIEKIAKTFESGAVNADNSSFWNERLTRARHQVDSDRAHMEALLAVEQGADSEWSLMEHAIMTMCSPGANLIESTPEIKRLAIAQAIRCVRWSPASVTIELLTGQNLAYLPAMASRSALVLKNDWPVVNAWRMVVMDLR